jgi:hypothetical protein
MRRKGLWVGAWALATLGATLVSWAAVRQVTAEVSPSQTLPFPSAVVLADDPIAAPDAPAPAPPADPDADEPATTESYVLTGGLVTVRYRGTTTTLVSAAPNSGFGAEVNDAGPEKVDVRFRSDGHESRFATRLRDGTPDPQTEERPR